MKKRLLLPWIESAVFINQAFCCAVNIAAIEAIVAALLWFCGGPLGIHLPPLLHPILAFLCGVVIFLFYLSTAWGHLQEMRRRALQPELDLQDLMDKDSD